MTHIPEPYNAGWSAVPGTIGTKVIPLYQSLPWECHLNTVHEICKALWQHLWHNYLKCGSKSLVLYNEDTGDWYKNPGTIAADDLAPDGAKSLDAIALVFFPSSIHSRRCHCSLHITLLPVMSDATYFLADIDALVQERCNSSALGMELHLSCTNPSIYYWVNWLFSSKGSSALAMELHLWCTNSSINYWVNWLFSSSKKHQCSIHKPSVQ